MKRVTLVLLLALFTSQCFCQVGLSGAYKTFDPAGWNEGFYSELNQNPYPMAGWQVGLDYWFRLKKRRIEFSPELSFSKFQSGFDVNELSHTVVGFHFNTDIYVFDLASDCNCPTFSKDGNFFSKGFFVEIAPGAIMSSNKFSQGDPRFETNIGEEFAFGGYAGVGLDLGFSDLFTITPIFRYHYYPDLNWDFELSSASYNSDLKQVFLGLRVRLHFKEFANARYR
jgi:hypothetical protein